MDLGFTSIPAVTLICWMIAQLVKALNIDNKWIPIVCGFSGGVLGCLAMYVMPSHPANDLFSAAAMGISSGLATTGMHQVFKQLSD